MEDYKISLAISQTLLESEGLRLKSYLCTSGKWTIGIGTTFYPDGTPVKKGEQCTVEQAYDMMWKDVNKRIKEMKLPEWINENQLAALVDFCYQNGVRAWLRSTLRLKIIARAPEEEIKAEFRKWVYGTKVVNGKRVKEKVDGIVARRERNINLFFKPVGNGSK